MKKLFILLTLINLLFSYNVDELKKIINSNSPKIDKILKSKDAIYLLEEAIFLDRFDLIKKAKKERVNFQITDKQGNTLLHLAAFLAKPKFVEYLIKYIDPNTLNKKGFNSLTMVILGINQVYPFVFNKNYTPKNKKSFEIKKIKENIIKTTDILKKADAKSEYVGNNSTLVFIRNYLEKFRYKKAQCRELNEFLLNHYFNDKQKMLIYFILGKDKKGKEILNRHIEFLKNPYYLDMPYHFLYLLAKLNRLDLAKYMINLAQKHNIDLVNYEITSPYAKNIEDLEDKRWAKKFWDYYVKFFKYGDEEKVYKLVLNKKYKELNKYIKTHFWQFMKDGYEVDNSILLEKITPFILAIYYKDKKAVNIFLKNRAYVSGWNELHYKILKNKPLNLEKYSKWEKFYKVNQGGLLDGITPITLSLIYNPKYLDELLRYIEPNKMSRYDFTLAIKNNLEDKLAPFVNKVSNYDLLLLAEKNRFDIIKTLYKKGVIDKYDLEILGSKLKNTKLYKKYLKYFEQ